jgi:Uma2 family endonuclease
MPLEGTMKTSKPPTSRYSYTDYLTWPDDQRWELIDGAAVAMVPAPTTRHQAIQQNLARLLGNHFRGKECRPFHAPVDVKLSNTDVVQPDLLVVCDKRKIEEQAIVGAPDLVIEITSASTEARDRREKKNLYERAAIPEYWIVSPNGFVERLSLGNSGSYGVASIFGVGETLSSIRFPDFIIAVSDLFEGVHLEIGVREPPPAATL